MSKNIVVEKGCNLSISRLALLCLFFFPLTMLICDRSQTALSQELVAQDSNNNQSQPVANLPVLKLGMRGPEVFWLQKRLQEIGLFQGSPDGVFGANTLKAVKALQEKYELRSDGIVGPSTWKVLLP